MEGERGACVGVFQTFIAPREGLEEATGKGATVITSNELGDCIDMLRTSTNPQVEYIIQVMRKWCDENAVAL